MIREMFEAIMAFMMIGLYIGVLLSAVLVWAAIVKLSWTYLF